jgi:hypothetical protein
MRIVGCVLMVSGWALLVAALVLLPALGLRFAFGVAGMLVEAIGLGVLAYGYRAAVRGADGGLG